MLYQDRWGRTWYPDMVDEMPIWQIDELGIHVLEENEQLSMV